MKDDQNMQDTAGRPAKTYIYQICEDTGCHVEDWLNR